MFGFLNINKPSGITSHKVISILRKITGIKQVGHGGTLDPLASGVLPIAIGKAAKLIDYLPQDKEYKAVMQFGKISDTFDIQGQITETGFRKITLDEIKNVIPLFQGKITQIPPAFSAVHYNGKRLYDLARNGKIPENIPSREVVIFKNNIVDFDYDKQILKLEIGCSKGTYIRTIVNDIGEILKAGAVMCELERTVSSGFSINNSFCLREDLTLQDIEDNLINPYDILPVNKYEINEEEYNKIINGNKFNNRTELEEGNLLLIKDQNIIALAVYNNKYIQPKKVFV